MSSAPCTPLSTLSSFVVLHVSLRCNVNSSMPDAMTCFSVQVYILCFRFPLVILALLTQGEAKDLIIDFCRRFDHRTAIVNNRLYIDGRVAQLESPLENPGNVTS